MITGTIANGVIQIVLGGVAAAKKQIASVQAALQKTAAAAKQVSTTAAVAFASASASVTAFARAADPLGSLQMDIALARVSVQLGRFFIPLLHQATDALNKLADYLASLSDETRESVLHWTKLALAVTGVLTLGGKLIGVFGGAASTLGSVASAASGVVSVLWRILGFLGPWGRLIVIVGTLAAAFLGLSKAGESTEGVIGKIVSAGRAAWEALKNLWGKLVEVVGPAIAKAGKVIEETWEKITSAVSAIWEKLSARLGPSIGKLVDAIGALLSTIGPVIQAYVERWGRDFERFGQLVGIVFGKFVTLAEKLVGGDLVGAIEKAINAITRAIQAVQPYAEKLSKWLVAVLESDKGKDFGKAFEAFGRSIEDAISLAESFTEKIGAAFAAVDKAVEPLREALSGLWDDATSETGELTQALQLLATVAEKIGSKIADGFQSAAKRIEVVGKAVSEVWDKATSKTTSFLKVLQELGAIGQSIGNKIGEGFARISPYLERIGTVAGKVFADIKEAAAPVVKALVDAFDAVAPAVSKLFDKLAELGAALIRLGGAVKEFFGEKLAEALKVIRPVVDAVIDGITDKLEKFFKFIADGFEAIYPIIKAVIDAVGKAFVSVINFIRNALFDAIEAVTSVLQEVVNKINKLIDGINRVTPGKDIDRVADVNGGLKRPDNLQAPAVPDLPKRPEKPAAPPVPPQPPAPQQPAAPVQPQAPGPAVPLPGVVKIEVAPAPREKGEKKDRGDNKFIGQLLGGAKFIGIAEAMRAAQQATVPTKETAILEEIARGNKDGNALLEKIADNTGKGQVIGLK